MLKEEFDPTQYNFTPDITNFYDDRDDRKIWKTFSESDWDFGQQYIGNYMITKSGDMWVIEEIMIKNNKEIHSWLYYGKIPDARFAHELLINLELDVPVIQREIKINTITHD